MSYDVAAVDTAEQPTAVVATATSWAAFPALWPRLLDTVWTVVRSNGELIAGRNVMLYIDDVPNVEIGVEVARRFTDHGDVVSSTLPAGRAAMTTHRGSYSELGSAHQAVIEWCERHDLERIGPRWEIYAHWNDASPADPSVEVYYLVR